MTKLSEQDLQNVSGGITRMTQNDPSGSGSANYKPEEEETNSEAK